MKNSLILDKIMQRNRALVLPFPIFPFPSLPYLPTFHQFSTFPFSSFLFPFYSTFILPSPSTSLPCPFRIYQYSSFLLNLPNFLLTFPLLNLFLSLPTFPVPTFPLPRPSFFPMLPFSFTFFFPFSFHFPHPLFPLFFALFLLLPFFTLISFPSHFDFFPPGKKNFTPLVAGFHLSFTLCG